MTIDGSSHNMTIEELHEMMGKVRLPPQFTIKVETAMNPDVVYVVVMSEWDDIYNPGRPSMAFNRTIVDRYTPRDFWVHQLYGILRELWLHELHEWFTIDGEHYTHPHPNGLGSLA